MKKYLVGFIFIILSYSGRGQDIPMDKKISALFFGLDLNQEPSKIVNQSNLPFIKSISIIPGAPLSDSTFGNTTYRYEFSKHPNINSQVKDGLLQFESTIHGEPYGIFESILILNFKNSTDQIKEYKKLVFDFQDYGKRIKKVEKDENNKLVSQTTIYTKDKKYNIPKLEISIIKGEEDNYSIMVSLVISYRQDLVKKFLDSKMNELNDINTLHNKP